MQKYWFAVANDNDRFRLKTQNFVQNDWIASNGLFVWNVKNSLDNVSDKVRWAALEFIWVTLHAWQNSILKERCSRYSILFYSDILFNCYLQLRLGFDNNLFTINKRVALSSSEFFFFIRCSYKDYKRCTVKHSGKRRILKWPLSVVGHIGHVCLEVWVMKISQKH